MKAPWPLRVGALALAVAGCEGTDEASFDPEPLVRAQDDDAVADAPHALLDPSGAPPPRAEPGCAGIADPPEPLALVWEALPDADGHASDSDGKLQISLASNLDERARVRVFGRVESDGERRDVELGERLLAAGADQSTTIDVHALLPTLASQRYASRISLRAEIHPHSGDVLWVHAEPVMVFEADGNVELYGIEAFRRDFPSGDHRGIETLPGVETDPETQMVAINGGISIAPPPLSTPPRHLRPTDESD